MQPAALADSISQVCGDLVDSIEVSLDEVNVDCSVANTLSLLGKLRDADGLGFDQLIDLCGVDYGAFGAENRAADASFECEPKLAVVYHLQSVANNHRVRVRVLLDEAMPAIASVCDLWPVANWFEREAFDMYGMVFDGHPDLRRLLTDYGFIGHPFRKDFPVSGHVEMRYDENKGRVVYQPVTIEPRVLVPRVIREESSRG